MRSCVFDASAVLALLLGEKGADVVTAHRPGALLSTVNYAEVLARLTELSGSADESRRWLARMELDIVPLDAGQAEAAAALRTVTQPLGLSLADRCCLALGLTRHLPVMTADQVWARADAGVEVRLIR